jgi:hypothetical protein
MNTDVNIALASSNTATLVMSFVAKELQKCDGAGY